MTSPQWTHGQPTHDPGNPTDMQSSNGIGWPPHLYRAPGTQTNAYIPWTRPPVYFTQHPPGPSIPPQEAFRTYATMPASETTNAAPHSNSGQQINSTWAPGGYYPLPGKRTSINTYGGMLEVSPQMYGAYAGAQSTPPSPNTFAPPLYPVPQQSVGSMHHARPSLKNSTTMSHSVQGLPQIAQPAVHPSLFADGNSKAPDSVERRCRGTSWDRTRSVRRRLNPILLPNVDKPTQNRSRAPSPLECTPRRKTVIEGSYPLAPHNKRNTKEACNRCKRKKTKCSGEKTGCEKCKEANLTRQCHYDKRANAEELFPFLSVLQQCQDSGVVYNWLGFLSENKGFGDYTAEQATEMVQRGRNSDASAGHCSSYNTTASPRVSVSPKDTRTSQQGALWQSSASSQDISGQSKGRKASCQRRDSLDISLQPSTAPNIQVDSLTPESLSPSLGNAPPEPAPDYPVNRETPSTSVRDEFEFRSDLEFPQEFPQDIWESLTCASFSNPFDAHMGDAEFPIESVESVEPNSG